MKTLREFTSEAEKENWLERNNYVIEVRWINRELWRSTLNGYHVYALFQNGLWIVKEVDDLPDRQPTLFAWSADNRH